nr:hypothetical protein [Myxococcota bacterium]
AAGLASALGGVSAASLGHPGHLMLAIALAALGLIDVASAGVLAPEGARSARTEATGAGEPIVGRHLNEGESR